MVSILVKEITPRIEYTMNLIFSEVMGVPHEITTSTNAFESSGNQKINYTKERIPGCLNVQPADLLYESELIHHDIAVGEWKKIPTLFANKQDEIPFDIFAATFFLVSRYEEYLPFEPDRHGRFEADQSIAFRNNFLALPVVDMWCQQLSRELHIDKHCNSLKSTNYKFTLTIDIDKAWMYKNWGLALNFARLMRELIFLNFREFKFKCKVLRNKVNDPGDSYNLLEKSQKNLSQKIKYFILAGGNHKFDANLSIANKNFQTLVQNLDKNNAVGLHPSFASNDSFELLTKEHKALSEMVGHAINNSRQHYLMLSLPDTYRRLIRLGIREDYTMGYGSRTGFRAGIGRPFYFYDLYEEKQTPLRVFPFHVMDRTLNSYLNLTPKFATEELKYYTDTIGSVGGHFITLWHNTSLNNTYEWKGWQSVFEEMIDMNAIK
jgi:hypothetical protein